MKWDKMKCKKKNKTKQKKILKQVKFFILLERKSLFYFICFILNKNLKNITPVLLAPSKRVSIGA